MIHKNVKQLLLELEFNSSKKVVQQLRKEEVSCGRDSFGPCKEMVVSAKLFTLWLPLPIEALSPLCSRALPVGGLVAPTSASGWNI